MPSHDLVDRDERLYRRIPLRPKPPWVEPEDHVVRHFAFIPHKGRDVDGISLIREKYRSAEQACCPPSARHREYVVAMVRAGDLMDLGLTLDVTPDDIDRELGTSAHISVREMNSARRKDSEVLDWARQIAEHCVRDVIGPFPEASQSAAQTER